MEGGNTDSVQQKLEDQITCSVCFEIFREPKVLSCYHVFCLLCLKSAAKKVKPGDKLLCPQCRAPVEIPDEGLSALKSAFHINSLIEIFELIQNKNVKSPPSDVDGATAALSVSACANCPGSEARYFCPQCNDFLCEDCRVIHGKWPKYSQHKLSSISGDCRKNGDLLCNNHPSETLTHYCQKCKLVVCSECLSKSDDCSHAEHILTITEALHQSKDAILTALEPIRRQLGTVEGVIERIRAKKKHIVEQAAGVISSIDSDFNGLRRTLEQRQATLKDAAEREQEGKLVGLKSHEDRAEVARVQLSNYLEGINNCLQKGSDLQVIKMQQAVEEKVKAIMQEFDNLPLSPVEEANLHYFIRQKDLSPSLLSHGMVYSNSIIATNCCASTQSRHWATACTETNICVIYVGDSVQCNWYDHIYIKLSSVDNTNTLVVTRREVYEADKQLQVVIYYIPITKGKKKLHITLYGNEISKSPLDLTVMAPFAFMATFIRCVSELRRPWGIALTHKGQLVVVDNQGWSGVHLFEANGSKIQSFVNVAPSNTPELLLPKDVCSEPKGVAISNDGKLLLVDGKRHRIQCLSFDGTSNFIVGSFGKQPLQFNDPVGITVSPAGEVLVCDRRNHRIQVLDPTDLSYVREIGKLDDDRPEGLYLPWDVACDSEGFVYIADCGHCCVKVFTTDGKFVKKIGSEGTGRGQFKHISSLAVDSNDYLYTLDMERACVTVFNPRGDFKMQFGTPGQLEGQFNKPHGIAVDNHGHVYVSDGFTAKLAVHSASFGGRVQVFQ